jgi:hypothetical protein
MWDIKVWIVLIPTDRSIAELLYYVPFLYFTLHTLDAFRQTYVCIVSEWENARLLLQLTKRRYIATFLVRLCFAYSVRVTSRIENAQFRSSIYKCLKMK